MAGEAIRAASGRHTRRTELEAVRQVSLAALIMLVVQYGLGIVLNLYIAVPAADAHAGLAQEIANGPLMLTLHALLGLALIVAALMLLVRAIRLEDREVAVLAAAGLTAIDGAFATGEIFVRNGQNGASLAMALLAGVATLCYIGALTRVSTGLRRAATTNDGCRAGAHPARAGGALGLLLCSTLVRAGFHAVVVPSGFRTRAQPQR